MDLAPLNTGIPASATTPPSARLPRALAWHALPQGEVLSLPGSGFEGLSLLEARRRLVESGPNELEETSPMSHAVEPATATAKMGERLSCS